MQSLIVSVATSRKASLSANLPDPEIENHREIIKRYTHYCEALIENIYLNVVDGGPYR